MNDLIVRVGTPEDIEAIMLMANAGALENGQVPHDMNRILHDFWPALNRQVRLEGEVTRASAERSDRYFAARPRESQLGAWASAQSEAVASRAELEQRFKELEARFAGQAVPRPSHWGVYYLLPSRIEFWLGQDARLHDRFSYTRAGGGWRVERLCP